MFSIPWRYIMDYIWDCLKSFLKWTGILLIAAGIFYVGVEHGGELLESWSQTMETVEREPIKLQETGPADRSM
jgi:hypothetical protein